jgi:hypothetical protein
MYAIFAGDLAHGLRAARRFQRHLKLEICCVLSSLLAYCPKPSMCFPEYTFSLKLMV